MRVLVTGGTGFVGRYVVRELLARGHEVRCLVRPGSVGKVAAGEGMEVFTGDALHPEAVVRAAAGCEAVVHLVGIIREFPGRGVTFEQVHVQATENVVNAAKDAGAQRFLHMSALGARPEPADPYHVTNFRAEELVQQSGLPYTIFRPSVIYGPEDQSINLFIKQIKTLRIVPVIGNGLYQMQPVPVATVAQAFALALELSQTENKTYEVGGPEPLTFNAIIDTLAEVLGRKVLKVHIMVWSLRLMAGLFGRFPWFPLTTGQIRMLLEGSTCDAEAFYRDFGLEAVSFREGLRRYMG
ncbi:MAG: complex I NDUFA9 subunit family protein [Syntrophales bacterium]|nr:complex I NDUFA9 subunit family protein [Syntrophales bacterium]